MSDSPREIKATMETLRKLFIMPDSPDKFVEFGNELLEMIHDFFREKGGIHSSISLPELSGLFSRTAAPGDPMLIKDVLAEIKDEVIAHSVKVGSPYYIGHMISPVPYFMILLEMIIAALNQNQVKIETAKASSFVERELVTWFHRLVFGRTDRFYRRNVQNPRVSLGNVTSDGTLANFTALAVAREKAFPPEGGFGGVRKEGMARGLAHYQCRRGVIFVSARAHYSIAKAANLLGVGSDNVVSVPVDPDNRMDPVKLRRRIRSLGKDERVIAIVGVAGTTETGSIDDLKAVGEIGREAGAHVHVDACWGGSVMLVDEYRHLFRGIERADSVSIDAHKLLYCPTAMGMVLFRSERDLNLLKHTSNYIIRRNSVDTGRFTVEGSRPFAALKPWASLKILGRQGYRLLFESAWKNTETLRALLESYGSFEVTNRPELFILNYRFAPRAVQEALSGPEPATRKINRLVNALNVKLHKALRRDDTTFVSRTTLESTQYRPQRIVVLRAVLANPLTNRSVLEEIVRTQGRIGLEMWREFEPAFRRIAGRR
ncbi:MAG: aspartate aminotransferase family protein [Deltaproteobacteria bacterium]|nr:aspartate aminotransferase family protein [Deltaproteobacteria bacterium]